MNLFFNSSFLQKHTSSHIVLLVIMYCTIEKQNKWPKCNFEVHFKTNKKKSDYFMFSVQRNYDCSFIPSPIIVIPNQWPRSTHLSLYIFSQIKMHYRKFAISLHCGKLKVNILDLKKKQNTI